MQVPGKTSFPDGIKCLNYGPVYEVLPILEPNRNQVTKAVIDLHYLPCIAYFAVLQRYGTVLLEKHEYYEKQTFRNRCYVNTAHGPSALIIPLTGKRGKVPVGEVRPDYSQKWVNNHWRTIRSGYGKAPFFEYYADDLHDILYLKYDLLYDLNRALLTMCLRWLRIDIAVEDTLSYEKQYYDEVNDLRSYITYGNKDFLSQVYKPIPYQQVFGNTFADNLSVIDLVFCCGPEASRILRESSER